MIEVVFTNGYRAKFPAGMVRFAHMGQAVDEEYVPDTSGGATVVNWDNVCAVRELPAPEEEDD